jgi:SAM-dependent methyltransferase
MWRTKYALLAASTRWPLLLNVLVRLLPPGDALAGDWDTEYASGGWDWLADLGQVPHNFVIAGYCSRLRPQAAILDVGCGEGTLHAILRQLGYRLYVGIDISAAAVERVAARTDERTRFLVVDGERFETNDRFDIIVLNEVLYYSRQPLRVIAHLSTLLAPDGLFIISMCQAGFRDALRKQLIWRDIGAGYQVLKQISLDDGGGLPRIIKVIHPREPAVSAVHGNRPHGDSRR